MFVPFHWLPRAEGSGKEVRHRIGKYNASVHSFVAPEATKKWVQILNSLGSSLGLQADVLLS